MASTDIISCVDAMLAQADKLEESQNFDPYFIKQQREVVLQGPRQFGYTQAAILLVSRSPKSLLVVPNARMMEFVRHACEDMQCPLPNEQIMTTYQIQDKAYWKGSIRKFDMMVFDEVRLCQAARADKMINRMYWNEFVDFIRQYSKYRVFFN